MTRRIFNAEHKFVERLHRPDRLWSVAQQPAVVRGGEPDQHADRLRRQRLSKHLHSLGARAIFEFLEELRAGEKIDAALIRYNRITVDMIENAGADSFPPYLWPAP